MKLTDMVSRDEIKAVESAMEEVETSGKTIPSGWIVVLQIIIRILQIIVDANQPASKHHKSDRKSQE